MVLTKPAVKRADLMNARAMEKYISLLLPITVFGVYLCTTTPVVYLGDSGEFTAAAFSLGIPHNSGYPLYSLLGKIFCMIPLGNVGFRMNLMSVFFSALTVSLVYTIIFRITSSILSSAVAASFLAFTPLFWWQTVSAEVYPLHMFFVALMIRLLWWWDENKEFHRLLLFVFVTGLSFGNHMQTVMLALPVLYFIISGDKKAIFRLRHFAAISVFFILSLTLYLYLPIRTGAGAAIHWGDPDNVERFLAHVTATAHRGAYVFSAGASEYLSRFWESLRVVGTQYGILLLLSIWGWLKLQSVRWKTFFVATIFLDLIYTVFLNTIALEITPFTLPSSIILAVLLGIGINDLLILIGHQNKVGPNISKSVKIACCIIPLIPLISNFGLCDQSRNYTAYEHAANIFRTAGYGSTVFLDGDNNVFPVAYGQIVEGMGEGVTLYDVHNVIFKWSLETYPYTFTGTWDEFKNVVVKRIIMRRVKGGVYFAVFNPFAIAVPDGFRLRSRGILKEVVSDGPDAKQKSVDSLWGYYYEESFRDNFKRDYMNREVRGHYYLWRGQDLMLSGRVWEGLEQLRTASRIGYNDTSIHSDIGIFLTARGFFEEARNELEKASKYYDVLSGVYNNWGYYHHKRGDYRRAIAFFQKALELDPNNYSYYNNLGFILHSAGKKEEALLTFRKSLSINNDQPEITEFIKTKNLQ